MVERRGVDVVFLVDSSLSMAARDVQLSSGSASRAGQSSANGQRAQRGLRAVHT